MDLPETGRWPDFLLIGTAKAGTTALFKALARHPDIFVPSEKEPRYFAFAGKRPDFVGPGKRVGNTVVSSTTAYLDLFRQCPRGKVTGEASTVYLFSDEAPQNAFNAIPKARILVLLRHPVDRAYSQWLHLLQEGMEPENDFESAWNLGESRLAEGWPHIYGYRERGFYGRQLKSWLDRFPREQVCVLYYEDWLERPAEFLAAVLRHVGVDDSFVPTVTRENVSSRQPRWKWLHHHMVDDNAIRRWAQRHLPLGIRDLITQTVTRVNLKSGPRLEPKVRVRLSAEFEDDIQLLESLTGDDLSRWKTWKNE